MKYLLPFAVIAAIGSSGASAQVTLQNQPDAPQETALTPAPPDIAPGMVEITDDLDGIGLDYLDLYADPKTMPIGPFLGFDHNRRKLVVTVYMVPITDIEAHKPLSFVQIPAVDHVELAFNQGHMGGLDPHYHILVWHITKAEQIIIAKGEPPSEKPNAVQPLDKLAKVPDFIPALGTLYVDPKTLPVGPYYGYDRNGRHVDTVYMVPLKDMNDKKRWSLPDTDDPIDHTDIFPVPGHPAVPVPHYHIVQWHISRAEQAAMMKPLGNLAKEPPPAPFQRYGEMLLGSAATAHQYVDPSRPEGPYFVYGRNGQLAATIYTLPVAAIEEHRHYENLPAAGVKVDHVEMNYNPGRYGVTPTPFQVVLWHVSPAEEAVLVK